MRSPLSFSVCNTCSCLFLTLEPGHGLWVLIFFRGYSFKASSRYSIHGWSCRGYGMKLYLTYSMGIYYMVVYWSLKIYLSQMSHFNWPRVFWRSIIGYCWSMQKVGLCPRRLGVPGGGWRNGKRLW